MSAQKPPQIPLPKSWTKHVRSAVLQVISLAQFAAVYTRSWAVDSVNGRVRLRAELDRANHEVSLLREEMRIKDARMASIDPHRRPHYPPTQRMAILELKAARGWSLEQTARGFHVTAATIASWIGRVDDEGPDALLQLREPVNRFPDFVRYVVQRLRVLCPTMGKVKIAEILARAGLHLGVTTVGRILKEKPVPTPKPAQKAKTTGRVVTSKYPNHVWLVDLTVVPTGSGLWCSWLPFALPQRWPFCWWVGVAIDHFSRRTMGFATFDHEPDAVSIRCFLARAIHRAGTAPRHLISDKGKQFWPCAAYRSWCRRRGIRPRFGAVGQHGSIAVVERYILTMKQLLGGLTIVPLRRVSMGRELAAVFDWYNEHRPHMTLAGKTPNEKYRNHYPASRRPRLEPRQGWPRGSPCATPWALVAGKPGDQFSVGIHFHAGRRHLPVVTMKRAA
jgi:transposase InsO family protein